VAEDAAQRLGPLLRPGVPTWVTTTKKKLEEEEEEEEEESEEGQVHWVQKEAHRSKQLHLTKRRFEMAEPLPAKQRSSRTRDSLGQRETPRPRSLVVALAVAAA